MGPLQTVPVGPKQPVENSYDSDGNRTTTSKNGTLTGTSRWDINNPLPQLATETNAAGALLAYYQYDPDGTARSMDRTTGKYYFTQDLQKSVSTVYDAAGTDNYSYTYDSWGKTTGTATITGGQTSPFGYTGQYKDQTLPDRLQLRARSYDPAQQRFTTTAPVPAPLASPNHSAYNYANNDPLNLSDPSGACPMCIGAGIGAVFGGGIYALTHEGEFSWRDFAIATGKGAVIGAGAAFLAPAGTTLATTLGLTGGRALAGAALTNAGVGAAYTWAINTAQCQPTTPSDLLLGAAGGAASNLLGPAWRGIKGWFTPKVNPFPNIDVNPRAIVWLNTVYRGDVRNPADVFPSGVALKEGATNTDLLQYGIHNTPSMWVGTSKKADLAMAFPKGRKPGQVSWVYTIKPKGPGISMNRALSFMYPHRIEKDIVYPGGIDPSEILGAQWYVNGVPRGDFVRNPGYRGRS
nr:hypothetical protein OG409_38235 [Streptomyces sp. NBC_00974]